MARVAFRFLLQTIAYTVVFCGIGYWIIVQIAYQRYSPTLELIANLWWLTGYMVANAVVAGATLDMLRLVDTRGE